MWKINYCNEVSNRDIEIMEMLEWFKLMDQQSLLNDKFHNCGFNITKYDSWSRGMSVSELYKYYNK